MMKTFSRERLTEEERFLAKAFSDAMSAASGLVYKLDIHTLRGKPDEHTAHVLCYENDILGGYAFLAGCGLEEAEVTFIGKSKTVFAAMYDAITDNPCGSGSQAGNTLAIVNRKDISLSGWVRDKGFTLSNTEYRMNFDKSKFTPDKKHRLRTKSAGDEDADIVYALDASAFGAENARAPSAQDLLATKIAYSNDTPVGKMCIDTADGVFGIYGFVIEPEYRGKGFGREFLSGILEGLAAGGYTKIYLEVEEGNERALGLYKSLGFGTEAIFDYYRPEPRGAVKHSV